MFNKIVSVDMDLLSVREYPPRVRRRIAELGPNPHPAQIHVAFGNWIAAARYGAEALPALEGAFNNVGRSSEWESIAWTIGRIGGAEAARIITNRIISLGSLGFMMNGFDARSFGPYLVNLLKNIGAPAVQYLETLSRGFWTPRPIKQAAQIALLEIRPVEHPTIVRGER